MDRPTPWENQTEFRHAERGQSQEDGWGGSPRLARGPPWATAPAEVPKHQPEKQKAGEKMVVGSRSEMHRPVGRAGDFAYACDSGPDLVAIDVQKRHQVELRQREGVLRVEWQWETLEQEEEKKVWCGGEKIALAVKMFRAAKTFAREEGRHIWLMSLFDIAPPSYCFNRAEGAYKLIKFSRGVVLKFSNDCHVRGVVVKSKINFFRESKFEI